MGRTTMWPQGTGCDGSIILKPFFGVGDVQCLGIREKSPGFPSEVAYDKCMTERILEERKFCAASSSFHQSNSL